MAFASTSTEFAMLDARRTSGAFVLPTSSSIPGRILNIKDPYGAFTNSSITVYTAPGDLFEDGTNFKVLNNAYDQLQLYAASTSRWYVTGGTEQMMTTTNVAVVSTIQTFNWPSLCNHPNFGYASTFNPAAVGRISLLDNIFTSSTAALASTFIEMGNLNAQPFGMNPGGAFRWLAGVEQGPTAASGLAFKLKRWTSFGMVNSPLLYGANNSTIVDTVTATGFGYLGLNNSNPNTTLDINPAPIDTETTAASKGTVTIARPGYVRGGNSATQLTNALVIFCGQNSGNGEGGAIAFDHSFSGYFSQTRGSRIASIADSGSFGQSVGLTFATGQTTITERMRISGGGNVGIGTTAPVYTLDVNGIGRSGMPVSSVTGTSANIGLTGYGILYYITNSGFNSLVLPSTDPSAGWFVTLRNNTGSYLSVTITGTNSKIPASPFIIPISNSVTLAYDASPPSGGCNWVYF